MGGRGSTYGPAGAGAPTPQQPAAQPQAPQAPNGPAGLAAQTRRRDIAAYMQTTYGITIRRQNIDAVSVDALRIACEGIEDVIREFPGTVRFFRTIEAPTPAAASAVGLRGSSWVAAAGPDGSMYLSPKYWASETQIEGTASRNVRSKHHPKGTAKSFMQHEAGHILTAALIDKVVKEAAMQQVSNGGSAPSSMQIRASSLHDWRRGITAKKVLIEAISKAQGSQAARTAGRSKTARGQIVGAVSGYAKANDMEAIAECVADYASNGRNAHPISREVWSILKRELA